MRKRETETKEQTEMRHSKQQKKNAARLANEGVREARLEGDYTYRLLAITVFAGEIFHLGIFATAFNW